MSPRGAGGRERAEARELRRTAEVVAVSMLPRWLSGDAARSLRAPIALAGGCVGAAVVLVTIAGADAARTAWGAVAVAALVAALSLLLPAARILLSSPPLAAAVARSAPLLRALELGDTAIARHWALAAVLPSVSATAGLGVAAAIALGAHGALSEALAIVGSVTLGALLASALARRGGARLAARRGVPPQSAMPLRRLAVLAIAGCLAPAAAPLLQELGIDPAVRTAAAIAGALTAAVWVVGDLLTADARAGLRLCRALIDCGAPLVRVAAPIVGCGLALGAVVGAAVGSAAGAVAGDVELGMRAAAAALLIGCAAPAALVLEPAPTAILRRSLVFALAISPAVASLLGGGHPGWTIAAAAAVAAVGALVLARRIA